MNLDLNFRSLRYDEGYFFEVTFELNFEFFVQYYNDILCSLKNLKLGVSGTDMACLVVAALS